MKYVMLLILFVTSYVSVAAIYQWTDEQGITHFSDNENKPESATEIEVKLTPPSIASLTQSSTPAASTANSNMNDMPLMPIGIYIRSPQNQQTLRNNSGDITVSATLSRTLTYGLNIRLLIDGVIHREQVDTLFNVSNVPIGTHKLQLQIVNSLGKVIASSELITVYLHRFKAH